MSELPSALAGRRQPRGRLRTLFGPIRIRLALIVLIAAVPLLMLSATIAWQNYRLALDVTSQTVARLREAAVARQTAAIAGAEQMMQALSQVAELSNGNLPACHDRLASVLLLQTARYSNIAASDRSGAIVCAARDIPDRAALARANIANASLFAEARQRRDIVLGAIHWSPLTSQDIIPAVYPIQVAGQVVGFVYAGLRIDWFRQSAGEAVNGKRALWIADPTGRLVQVSDTDRLGLPPSALVTRLEHSPVIVDARSAGGVPYAYASAQLSDGYSLIVAYPARLDQAAATDLLIRRFGQLGLLLLLGLAAVAVGTHLALVEPLTRLSQGVAEWRAGGTFEPNLTSDPPTEIRDLAASFAEATDSLRAHAIRQVAAVEKQDLLMKEIHHRVKNNLQIVASLLNLQAARIRQPEARAEFASARDRVRALATLHRYLYLQGEVHTIDMPAFLKELCGQIFDAMGETAGKRIKLEIEASPLQMHSDQAVPLSLIVTEAVSNAVKYAFPKGRAGAIHVRLTDGDGSAELVVEDDGVGIPAGRTETETGTRDGLGLTLIRGFARQLGGTLQVEEMAGTRYVVRVPLSPGPEMREA